MVNIANVLQSPFHGVFCIPLSLTLEAQYLSCLSEDEKSRMDRYRQPDDMKRHALAHSFKRRLLSRLLSVEPQALRFSSGERGKPYCDAPNAPWFNITHSGDWVIVGVSELAEIGVDVESAQRKTGKGVVDYALTADQKQIVDEASDPALSFMCYWTQKEAISKAMGVGLSVGFQTLECSGQLGSSEFYHGEQTIYVQTGLLACEHVLSIASLSIQYPLIYRVDNWTTCHLLDVLTT